MHRYLARLVYFGSQTLRGEAVKEALRDVKRTEFTSAAELRSIQAERQIRQLQHAVTHVPYYREKYRDFADLIENAHGWDSVRQIMEMLPTLSKGSIMDQPESFKAEGIKKIKTYPDKTSGSSGTPVIFPCDQISWAYRHALTFRCMQSFGVDIGESYAYFWGLHWSKKAGFESWVKDQIFNRIRVSAYNISPKTTDKYLKRIENKKPTHFLGYPSAIYDFCVQLYSRGIGLSHLKLKAIFLTAEPIADAQRLLIETVTGAKCVNIYGSAEGGLCAFECPHGSLHLTTEATWMEVLEKEQSKGTAVVTDMFLYAFPMIRYLIEDEVEMKPGHCDCGRAHHLLESIIGRSGEPITLPNGRVINANLPTYIFKPLAALGVIRRFRFVESRSSGLSLYLVVSSEFEDEHRRIIEKEIRNAFGEDIVCGIHLVNEIPPMANAKHRCYVRI